MKKWFKTMLFSAFLITAVGSCFVFSNDVVQVSNEQGNLSEPGGG
ncbi:hypothetical protein GCM10011571_06950 [Marinithermofilum abyssi]|jgi:hypothetical protein|uniref:Phr family secreted Rap phosphatase inhibitor n=1 Tax=Marinithermofilum abyssi TaxID=1571185 RepID=A0A8J2VGC0_9BACL|nr:hypothetical protein [Marinithermofilum abyssi]GGE08311.1 hypothetical protein GCM10011571_06950 [Marinithermofilum abyssi]